MRAVTVNSCPRCYRQFTPRTQTAPLSLAPLSPAIQLKPVNVRYLELQHWKTVMWSVMAGIQHFLKAFNVEKLVPDYFPSEFWYLCHSYWMEKRCQVAFLCEDNQNNFLWVVAHKINRPVSANHQHIMHINRFPIQSV